MTMAGKKKTEIQELHKCITCSTPPLDKIAFINHILGKRHHKNQKSTAQPQTNDQTSRTIHVTGFDNGTPVEAVVGVFLQYGIRTASWHKKFTFIELASVEMAKKAMSETHYCGNVRLTVSTSQQRKVRKQLSSSPPVPLSLQLRDMLGRRVRGQQLDVVIQSVVEEIELKPNDYGRREFLRNGIVQFLMPHFRYVYGYIFGSSANNLGFRGCDVDLFVDVGVYPWAPGVPKAMAECKASDLTWYLAREIRRLRRGIKVQAVARARVPIVKFEDVVTGLQVDLSFRNAMPVHNTRLIHQYTKTHPLVRPYLMIIRYWAKVQDVAGGAQPSYLITNYAFTMLMLFYLMSRHDPIVPSVSLLREDLGHRNNIVIDGWSCSFSNNVDAWTSQRHDVLIMELVEEFFNYYGNLDASQWVISPLAGRLLDKETVKDRDLENLPMCMARYCAQSVDLQTNTPLCLQDPFENSHNCTRGLKPGPLAEFQYKCRRAAEISRDILEGKKSLRELLEVIEITPEILREIDFPDSRKETTELDQSQGEVITLDDSDSSQDSIEILDQSSGKKYKEPPGDGPVSSRELNRICIEVTNLSDDDNDVVEVSVDEGDKETLDKTGKPNSASDGIAENGVAEASQQDADCDSHLLPECVPEKKLYKFQLDFTNVPDFSISFDGALSGGKRLMSDQEEIGQVACALVQFSLQQCLKVDVSVINAFSGNKKRKSLNDDDTDTTGKRIKGTDGESVPVIKTYRRLAQFNCVATTQLWIGRKKISKTVPTGKHLNPLQHELAITDVQLRSSDEAVCLNSADQNLNFTIEMWQKCSEATRILVTGDSKSNVKITRGQMIPMFSYLTSHAQNLLRKVKLFVNSTSSKR